MLTVAHVCGWLNLKGVFKDEWRKDLFNAIKPVDKEKFNRSHLKNANAMCDTCDFCIKFTDFF